MVSKNGKMHDISQILRGIYKNQTEGGIHRNTLRKQLVSSGKFSSKAEFDRFLEGLIALGKVKADRDMISLDPKTIEVGLLQKINEEYYISTPSRREHLPTSKAVAAGYKPGDVLDISIEYMGKKPQAIILGRSQKVLDPSAFIKSKPTKKQEENNQNNEQKVFAGPKTTIEKDNLLLGRVVDVGLGNIVFIPNKKSLPIRHIPINNNKDEFAKFKNRICVMELVSLDSPLLGGEIVEIKGEAGNPIHEFDAIAENYGSIMTWNTPELQTEIAKIPSSVDVSKLDLISEKEAQISQRGKTVDLRHLPFSTIDPASCKDMDDAMYSTIDENGDYVVYTAVANVTKYVDLNSAIGQNYIQGAFTTYAPNKAYGILPDELSTVICSLNPDEDRLAFVVKTVIDKISGQVKSSNIYDSVIRSRHKYSYEEAQEITDTLGETISKNMLKEKLDNGESLSLDEQILMNHYAAEAIKAGFTRRRMIRFTSNTERNITFDEDMRDIVDICPAPHLPYHEVVEYFMLTANETAAKMLKDLNLNGIYRIHEEPNAKNIGRAKEFFDILGISSDDNLSAQTTNQLVDIVKNTPYEETVNEFLIKMQSRAVYSKDLYSKVKIDDFMDYDQPLISHYALQSPHYSHTTAPIRRVVDYITHYNILANIHGNQPIGQDVIDSIIETANQRQLDIDQAEKDFVDISSVIYAEKHIGETFKGRISKFRLCSNEENYNDDILVIVRNQETGISAEIPLSQVVGKRARNCSLSSQSCAVYDERGNVVLKLCAPLDFIVEKADRISMTIVGRTNREMVKGADRREQPFEKYYQNEIGFVNRKSSRKKRFEQNKQIKRDRREHHKNKAYGDE